MGNVMIPEEIATMAGGPEPIGPPGEPPMAPPGPPMGGGEPPGGGLPPELAGLFGGGGDQTDLSGAPPGGPEGAPRDDVEILSEIVDLWMEYMGTADDDIEKSKATQGLKVAQDLLASNQKEQEAAAGVGPAQKGMAKAIGGGGGAAY